MKGKKKGKEEREGAREIEVMGKQSREESGPDAYLLDYNCGNSEPFLLFAMGPISFHACLLLTVF